MVNHPNRKKVYPDTTLEKAVREAGYRCNVLVEHPGPKDTNVAWIVVYRINGREFLVSTLRDGGWEAYGQLCQLNDVKATVEAVLSHAGLSQTQAA